MPEQPATVQAWHAVVQSRDPALLDDLLADDVVFRSPAAFAPKPGKDLTVRFLSSAIEVLGPSLRYVAEWYDQSSAVLEFEAELDGMYVHGVDILRWNDDGKLISFTVMVRPMSGLQKLVEQMQPQLALR
jgi:SnoaL-like domain